MNAPKLPTVRLSAVCGGEPVIEDSYLLEPAPSNRLIVSYAPESRSSAPVAGPSFERPSTSSEGEPQSSEGESGNDDSPNEDGVGFLTGEAPEPSPVSPRPGMGVPQLSRTLSMPLPSQLMQLQHPHRPGPGSRPNSFAATSQFRDLSVELADSIQMAIQTMLQISPPQVLDAAKEQFSACSLSVPTSSMSAVFTAMKNLNYISANMAAFAGDSPPVEDTSLPGTPSSSDNEDIFDIGEMLQCVGDALSGAAAQAGVDLVLYHGDAGLRHIYVSGDENGISYVLSHVLRQVLNTASQGDSIELGLLVSQVDPLHADLSASSPTEVADSEEDHIVSSPIEVDTPLKCSIRILHKYAPVDLSQSENDASSFSSTLLRPDPSFDTLLLRRLLCHVRATLTPSLPLVDATTPGRLWELSVTLDRGVMPPSLEVAPEDSNEPTLDQLGAFIETLKGKRGTLYASPKGSFAQHLTSYLTAWGMDVSHVSPDGNIDGLADLPTDNASIESRANPTVPTLSTYGANPDAVSSTGISAKVELRQGRPEQPSFIFIDDDVQILKERLYALHAEQQPQPPAPRSKRPTLSSHHRKSSPQITRLLGQTAIPRLPPAVIIHFTSLSNYRISRDAIQSVMILYTASSTPIPEVMILPKPAGPRRLLTALHTAVTKPTIDPFFSPIATSPMSPSVQFHGSFFHPRTDNSPHSNPHAPSSVANRPGGSRSNSDRSTRSGKEVVEHTSAQPPSSPLGLSDNVEYFSEAAMRLGSSPSTGLVIQSPDGQPAGIFFHPRGKTSRNPSNQSVDRDKGQFIVPATSRRGSTSRNTPSNSGDVLTFSSLHALPGGPLTPRSPPQVIHDNLPPASSAAKAPIRKPSDVSTSLSTATVTPSRRGILDASRRMSPPVSPNETSRRALAKRPEPTIAITAAAKKAAAPGDGKVIPPISVLIVDDNIINQTILSTFMRKKKIKYDIAKNGLEAVQKWRTGGFHLILMDIQMPVMDGIEATKEIRRLERSNAIAGYPPLTPSEGSRTPPVRTPSETSSAGGSTDTRSTSTASPYRSSVIIVALTASSLQSDRVAALAAGCNDFLTKPVSLLWLNNKIIEWGSIKALQMWDSVRTISSAQARSVAERLHVPQGRGTPSPSRGSPSNEDVTSAVSLVGGPAPMSAPISSSALASGGALPATIAPVSWTPAQSPSRLRGPLSPTRSNSVEGPSIAASGPKLGVSDTKIDADMLDANGIPKPNGAINHSIVDSHSDSRTPVAHSGSAQLIDVLHATEPVHTRENGLKHDFPPEHPGFSSPAIPTHSPSP